MIDKRALEGRLDPEINLYNKKLSNFKYKTIAIKFLLTKQPQYGSNQAGCERLNTEQPRYIRITDIDEWGYLKKGIGATCEVLEKKYTLKNSDILFARSGATVGKVYFHNQQDLDCVCIYAGYMIRFVFDETKCLAQYVHIYSLLTPYKEWVNATQRATGQPNINAEEYKNLQIPLPPLPVQQQIIQLFEAAYQAKQQKEAQAKALLAGIDAYLLQMLGIQLPAPQAPQTVFFTPFSKTAGGRLDPFYYMPAFQLLEKALGAGKYPIFILDSILTFIESGSRPSGGVSQYSEGVLSFGGEHVNTKYEVEIQNPKYIPLEFHTQNLRTQTQYLDVFIVKDGATTGKIAILTKENFIGQNINEHLFLMRFSNDVNPFYIAFMLGNKFFQNLIKRLITGATITGLTKDALKSIQIPLPPIDVQNQIADAINAMRMQAAQLEAEAEEGIAKARAEIERLILGDDV